METAIYRLNNKEIGELRRRLKKNSSSTIKYNEYTDGKNTYILPTYDYKDITF